MYSSYETSNHTEREARSMIAQLKMLFTEACADPMGKPQRAWANLKTALGHLNRNQRKLIAVAAITLVTLGVTYTSTSSHRRRMNDVPYEVSAYFHRQFPDFSEKYAKYFDSQSDMMDILEHEYGEHVDPATGIGGIGGMNHASDYIENYAAKYDFLENVESIGTTGIIAFTLFFVFIGMIYYLALWRRAADNNCRKWPLAVGAGALAASGIFTVAAFASVKGEAEHYISDAKNQADQEITASTETINIEDWTADPDNIPWKQIPNDDYVASDVDLLLDGPEYINGFLWAGIGLAIAAIIWLCVYGCSWWIRELRDEAEERKGGQKQRGEERRRLQQDIATNDNISHLADNAQPEIVPANLNLEGNTDNSTIYLGLAIIPAFCIIYYVYKRMSKADREDPDAAATRYAVRASLV